MSRRRRKAFTLVELLVVIAIIGILIGLLLPAVQMVRESARRAKCANSMNQLALGVLSFESAKGRFPGYQEFLAVDNRLPASQRPPGANKPATWIVLILPYIDRQDLHDRWIEPTIPAPPADTAQSALTPMMELTMCPSAPTRADGFPWNYYVANAGFYPRENPSNIGPKDPAPYDDPLYRGRAQRPANGIFHDLITFPRISVGVSDIRDGTSNTLMLSENIQAGFWSRWGYVDPNDTSNGVPEYARFATTFVWLYAKDGGGVAGLAEDTGVQAPFREDVMKVNGDKLDEPDGVCRGPESARPAAMHPGGANVMFAERHGMFLEEELDYTVYQQLMTPYGLKSDMPYRVKYVLRDADFKN